MQDQQPLPLERFTELERQVLETCAARRALIAANRNVLNYMERDNELNERETIERALARIEAEDKVAPA